MNSTGCDDGPTDTRTDGADSLLVSRVSATSGRPSLSSLISLGDGGEGCGDASSLSSTEDWGTGDVVWVVGKLELGFDAVYGATVDVAAESDDGGRVCILLLYCNAAISCAERGRDLRRSFWRRF